MQVVRNETKTSNRENLPRRTILNLSYLKQSDSKKIAELLDLAMQQVQLGFPRKLGECGEKTEQGKIARIATPPRGQIPRVLDMHGTADQTRTSGTQESEEITDFPSSNQVFELPRLPSSPLPFLCLPAARSCLLRPFLFLLFFSFLFPLPETVSRGSRGR